MNQWIDPTLTSGLRWAEELLSALEPQRGRRPSARTGVFPPVNIHDDGESFLVRAEIPGLEREQLEVTVRGEELTLAGERRAEVPGIEVSHHRRERDSGRFRRTVVLPQPVDAEGISATYRNGVLEVTLPRVPEVKPRRVEIN